MISDREGQKAEFLKGAGLEGARREALSGDASTRAYERLWRADGTSLIFMDQPPAAETQACPPGATPAERAALGYNALARLAAGRVDAFIAAAGYLRSQGLSAPAVLVADPAAGLAVLEDLGDGLYATLIADGQDEAPLYAAAIDALVHLHAARPPAVLEFDGVRWPLLTYDTVALDTADSILVEWLPKFRPALSFDPAALAEWEAIWAPIRARGDAGASVFCHRDYHAENLVWLPDREGPARVGMLDFQDAVLAHPAWDLSMLLHDARRQISGALETACLDRYLAARPGVEREAFLADFRALGALNVVRILGIFARLVTRDGKPKYGGFMPRLWGYIDNGRSRSGALLFDAEYVVTRRVALGVSLPLVWARYTDASSPPPFLPFLPRDQCRCWQSAWQDAGLTARINLVDTLDHIAAVTSTFAVVVPSHDYAYRGEAVAGRRLKEIRAGIDASYRVDAWSPNLSVSGQYTYAMVERVIGISTNRSNAALGMDYRLGADWSLGVSASLQRTHGGLRVGSMPPSDLPAPGELTTPERFAEHDRLLRDNWTCGRPGVTPFRAGGCLCGIHLLRCGH